MDVKYTAVLSDRLHTVPIINGQLIAVTDEDQYYYDLGGKRRTASGQMHVSQLPEEGQPNMIYILDTGNKLSTGIFIWNDDAQEFICMASPNVNTEVTSTPSNVATKVYLVGTLDSAKTTGELLKSPGVYVNTQQKSIVAQTFVGTATLATKANNDDKNQNIAETYIKDVAVADRTITLTKGDGTEKTVTVGQVATASVAGVVKSGTDITVDASGNVSVKDNSHKHKVENISDLTASATELNYMKGVTSSVQAQIDTKAPIASPTFTGTPKAPTPAAGTNDTQIATTAFVQQAAASTLSEGGSIILKGAIGTGGTVTALPTTYKVGWAYRVISNGTYAGNVCEPGDVIVAIVARSGSGNSNSDWIVLQGNIDGAITSAVGDSTHIQVTKSGAEISVSHKDISVVKGSTATSGRTAAPGDTISPVASISVDTKGHVTGIYTESIVLPKYTATSPIAISGTTITHANSGVTGGTYNQVTVNATGHVIAGSQKIYSELFNTTGDSLVAGQLPAFFGATEGTGANMLGHTSGAQLLTRTGTADLPGISAIVLGNEIPSGTAGNKFGAIRLYGDEKYYVDLVLHTTSRNTQLYLPTAGGTLATTSQIPVIRYGTDDPDDSVGKNGDLYIQIIE